MFGSSNKELVNLGILANFLRIFLKYTYGPYIADPLVHNSILVTDYLTKMGIKTVPQPPYRPYLAPCDFWLFPKLRGCRYETIEKTKEAVTNVIDTLTQEDIHGAFQKLLERYNKCNAAGGEKYGNLSYAPRICMYVHICIFIHVCI